MLLARGAPARDLVAPLRHEGADGFQAVGGLQALPEGPKHAQAVRVEGFFEPLVEALHGGLIEHPELLATVHKGCLRCGLARALVGLPELRAPGGSLSLREVGYDVSPLVPLAMLDHGVAAEDGGHGLP